MQYKVLGKTGLKVSEIGFGGEWLERHPEEESVELMRYAAGKGINIVDCWMPDPKSRDIIGKAMKGNRENWYVQGHFGATWQNGQYVRTRDMKFVKPAFEDLLARLGTDYIDIGMIHYVDSVKEWNSILESDYLKYVLEMKEKGVIRHIGLSSHDPETAALAVKSGLIEMLLFSINPAFDMLPSGQNLDELLAEGYRYDSHLAGINTVRADLYRLCEEHNVGITVMKGFAGGRLFDAKRSPFG
ncbi:MAG: aldo/keto reductase, partial [Clostridia bacterium]|nr:aldo/keto reductase [Clostridia bacterium]